VPLHLVAAGGGAPAEIAVTLGEPVLDEAVRGSVLLGARRFH
jgi:hypothetical protein